MQIVFLLHITKYETIQYLYLEVPMKDGGTKRGKEGAAVLLRWLS